MDFVSSCLKGKKEAKNAIREEKTEMAKIVKAVAYTILLYVFLMSEIVSLNIYYIIKIKIGDLCASLNKSSTL